MLNQEINVRLDTVRNLIPLFTLTFLLFAAPTAFTEETSSSFDGLRAWVLRELAEAQDSLQKKDFSAGVKVLDDLLKADAAENSAQRLNSYERANIYNMRAYASYATGDYAQAMKDYEAVVAQKNIPSSMRTNTLFTIVQLNFSVKDFAKGMDYLDLWFDLVEEPNAGAYALSSQGNYQLRRYELAIRDINTAIKMRREMGTAPSKGWYRLAEWLYEHTGELEAAEKVRTEMLTMYPETGEGILPRGNDCPNPIVKVAPVWPKNARDIEGECTVSYSVSDSGRIYDVKVVTCQPEGYFEEVSIRATQKFEYAPKDLQNDKCNFRELTNTFTFKRN